MKLLPEQQQRNNGITLFLSILVMSSISAIAFSVAAVTFVEIQTAGDVQRTEPSYYSDQGITEEAIYTLKRKVPTPPAPQLGLNCASAYISYTGPDTSISSQTKICDIAASNNIEVRISPAANSYSTSRRFYLYNPSNYGAGPGGYGSVTVNNTSTNGTAIHVYICKLINDCQTSGSWDAASNVDILAGNSRTFVLDGTANDGSYELAITNLTSTNPPQDAFAQIITLDTTGAAKGLPYLNKKAVQIQSTRLGLTRRVEVLIPTE